MTDSKTVEAVALTILSAKLQGKDETGQAESAIASLQSLGWRLPDDATAENTALLVSLADIRIKTGVGATPMLNELAEAISSKQKADVEAACVAAQRDAFNRVASKFDSVIERIRNAGDDESLDAIPDLEGIAASIRALSPLPGPCPLGPEGFVVVPKEPSDDQMESGMKALHSYHKNYGDDLKAAYRAMIAASEVKP